MTGRSKCKILREIRRWIAEENDIPFVTRDCAYQGSYSGTCPRCESELRYLERQLSLRAALGKRAAVAALCAGMTLASVGCAPREPEPFDGGETELAGAVAWVEESPAPRPDLQITTGEIAWPEEPEDESLLPAEDPVFCPDTGV